MREAGVIHDIHQYSFYNTRLKELHVASKPNARISTNRTHFDIFLLREALKSPLLTYIDNTFVQSIEVRADNVLIKNRAGNVNIEAKMVVIATGNNSTLPKEIVPANSSMGHFMLAARGYYKNLNVEPGKHSTRNYIIQKPVRCYIFIAELPGNLATVELFVLKDIAVKHHVSPKTLLLNLIKEHPALQGLFANAKLEGKIMGISVPYTSSKQSISSNRVLLTGVN